MAGGINLVQGVHDHDVLVDDVIIFEGVNANISETKPLL